MGEEWGCFQPISVVSPFHKSLLGAQSKPGLERKDHMEDLRWRNKVQVHVIQATRGPVTPHGGESHCKGRDTLTGERSGKQQRQFLKFPVGKTRDFLSKSKFSRMSS